MKLGSKRRRCAVHFSDKVVDGMFRPAKMCRHEAIKDSVYCKKHQVLSGPTHCNTQTAENIEKRDAGYARWRAAMKRAKEITGELDPPKEKKPRGRPKGGKNKPKVDRAEPVKPVKVDRPEPVLNPPIPPGVLMRAEKIIAHERAQLPALPDIPFEQMEPHQKLTALTGTALDITMDVLRMPREPEKTPVLFKEQMKLVPMILNVGVKVDRNKLMARKQDRLVELIDRLKGETGGGPVIDMDDESKLKKK